MVPAYVITQHSLLLAHHHKISIKISPNVRSDKNFALIISLFLWNKLQVIGDKTAWDTAVMLRLKGTDAIYEMEEKLGVKVKFLHVVRNPFDNIATFVLRHRDIQARTADPDIKVYTEHVWSGYTASTRSSLF